MDVAATEIHNLRKDEGRSFVEETNVDRDFEEDTASIMFQLEEKMNTTHFSQLLSEFVHHVSEDLTDKPKSRLRTRQSQQSRQRGKRIGLLNLEEFQTILENVLEIPVGEALAYNSFKRHSEILFRKIDLDHNDLISWDEFCSYVMLKGQEDYSKQYGPTLPFMSQSKQFRIPNVKETIAKVVRDINPSKYIVISKDGILAIVNSRFDVHRYVEIEGAIDDDRGTSKRRTKVWITDAIMMPNASKLVLSTTNRELWFYDLSTPAYKPQFLLGAIPSVPICMDYTYDAKDKASPSRLFLGTDGGDIHILTFHLPRKGLFETPFKNSESCWQIFFTNLPVHHRRVSHQVLSNVHSDWIRRIAYVRENDVLISCSSSAKDSMVWRDVEEGKKRTYIFRVTKGIDCFDYNKKKNIIVTGGMDHIVRLWDPYVTHKPIALMKGHQTSISDVHIYEPTNKIFSFSKDGDLRAWDIKEQWCVQHILIKLPLGSSDFGSNPLFRVSRTKIWLSVENCLVELKIKDSKTQTSGDIVTHSAALCGAVYNASLHQVITGSEESEISVWDAETGKRISTASCAYRREVLSSFCLSSDHNKVIVASRGGSLSVWNWSNGLMEYTLKRYDKSEMSDVVILPDRSLICAVGWSRRIQMYSSLNQEGSVPYLQSWASFEAHEDDILCVAYYPPNTIATGSFNGEIKLWSLDREKMIGLVREANHGGLTELSLRTVASVDRLLFLMTRSQHNEAVLVSSSGGVIEFWYLYSYKDSAGSFTATNTSEASILAMCTTPDEGILITGDSTGFIAVWYIGGFCRGVGYFSGDKNLSSDPTFISRLGAPEKQESFQAHSKAVSSVVVIERLMEMYILSASHDCTAKIFTMQGQCIGTFGQKVPWELSSITRSRSSRSDQTLHSIDMRKNSVRKDSGADQGSPQSSRPSSTSSLPKLNASHQSSSKDSFTKDIQTFKNSEYYRSRSLILDTVSESKGSWSFLGENYNDNVKKRMTSRRLRRENLPFNEINADQFGKEGSPFTPFKALHTSETEDPVLPRNLPVTPRMMQRHLDVSNLEWLEHCQLPKEKESNPLYSQL